MNNEQHSAPSVTPCTGDEAPKASALTLSMDPAIAGSDTTMALLLEGAMKIHSYPGPSFQRRVEHWMHQCFAPSLSSNMTERGDRLLEEVLELLQAHGYDPSRVATLVQYVFGRPVGVPAQEVGGVMVTLAAYCSVARLEMVAAGEFELSRVNQPEVMANIRQKQQAKNALKFDTPLPGAATPDHSPDATQIPTQYSWSTNEEEFHDQVSSVEEAVAAAVESRRDELQPGRVVYVGEVIPVRSGELIKADDVIDRMWERAYEEAGESSEDYLGSITQAQKDELHALIVGWADLVEEPGFWRVSKIVKHTLTAEDLDHSCEGGARNCGRVAHYDSEATPLCQSCWDALQADSQATPGADRG